MKKIDIAQSITLLANLGVIAGIVFLAYELRQNNQFLAAQVSASHHDAERERRRLLITNEGGIAEIVLKSENQEELTELEEFRLLVHYNNVLEDFEWQFGEYQAGRFPEEWLNVTNWRGMWNSQPGLVNRFLASESSRNPAFIAYWRENVIDRTSQ